MCKCHDDPTFLCNQGRMCPMRESPPSPLSWRLSDLALAIVFVATIALLFH